MDGFRSLMARPDIDAVLLLSSNWYGALPILASCDAGKAIYCASSLEIDLEKAQEVKRRVEQSGIAFMFEFPRRFAPATLRLKELLATCLGPPRLIFCHWRLPVAFPRPRSVQWPPPDRCGPRSAGARGLVPLCGGFRADLRVRASATAPQPRRRIPTTR